MFLPNAYHCSQIDLDLYLWPSLLSCKWTTDAWHKTLPIWRNSLPFCSSTPPLKAALVTQSYTLGLHQHIMHNHLDRRPLFPFHIQQVIGSYSRGNKVWVEGEMLMEQQCMSWKPEPHVHDVYLCLHFPSHICHLHLMTEIEVAQSCLTLCDPMDCSLRSSIHGIFQARVLEWIAISFSRRSSQLRDRTWICCIIDRRFLPSEPPPSEVTLDDWMMLYMPCFMTQVHPLHYEQLGLNASRCQEFSSFRGLVAAGK